MNKYPCANTTCTNLTHEANTLCEECRRREDEAGRWIANLSVNLEKEQNREQYNKNKNHKKGGRE